MMVVAVIALLLLVAGTVCPAVDSFAPPIVPGFFRPERGRRGRGPSCPARSPESNTATEVWLKWKRSMNLSTGLLRCVANLA
jgi:hypothetical protein